MVQRRNEWEVAVSGLGCELFYSNASSSEYEFHPRDDEYQR